MLRAQYKKVKDRNKWIDAVEEEEKDEPKGREERGRAYCSKCFCLPLLLFDSVIHWNMADVQVSLAAGCLWKKRFRSPSVVLLHARTTIQCVSDVTQAQNKNKNKREGDRRKRPMVQAR